MKQYKFITIRENGAAEHGRPSYDVLPRSGHAIGEIWWYNMWKRYILGADENAAWSSDCLRDVADFIENHAGKDA